MSFQVYELPKAKADKRHIFEWLHERSRQGAIAWLNAYDAVIERLKSQADVFADAFENKGCLHVDVKQAFFKTRRGRVYRMLFFIDGRDVFVLRVRGPGHCPRK